MTNVDPEHSMYQEPRRGERTIQPRAAKPNITGSFAEKCAWMKQRPRKTKQRLSQTEQESRRFEAAADFNAGLTRAQVARKYRVSRRTAGQWRNRLITGTLESKPRTGRGNG